MSVNVDKTFVVFLDTMGLQQTFLSGREHSLQNIVTRSGFSCKFLWFLIDIFQNFKDVWILFQIMQILCSCMMHKPYFLWFNRVGARVRAKTREILWGLKARSFKWYLGSKVHIEDSVFTWHFQMKLSPNWTNGVRL